MTNAGQTTTSDSASSSDAQELRALAENTLSASPSEPSPEGSEAPVKSLIQEPEAKKDSSWFKKPPQSRWEQWALTATILVLLLLPIVSFIGLLYSTTQRKLLEEGHPLKLSLLISFMICISWLVDRFFAAGGNTRLRELVWGLAAVIAIGLNIGFYVHSLKTVDAFKEYKDWYGIGAISFMIAIVLLTRLINNSSNKPSADAWGIERTGRTIALVIMIMAMFFYALEMDHNTSSLPHFKWGEVAAILIIFLLAELGVMLVTKSAEIRERVIEASGAASDVVAEAKNLQKDVRIASGALGDAGSALDGLKVAAKQQLEHAEQSANVALDQLQRALQSLQDLAGTELGQLWHGSAPEFYKKVGLEPGPFWNHLTQFIKDWTPGLESDSGPEGQRMVGTLFENFVGTDSINSGSVRKTEKAISCVTVDTVFAEASVEWLNSLAASSEQEGKLLVVWAISTLLPTDFALPSLWWETSGAAKVRGQLTRTDALNRFVEAVIRDRKEGKPISQYRRITVVKASLLQKFQKEFEPSMRATLDNWFLWDPRVEGSRQFNEIGDLTARLAELVWRQIGKKDLNEINAFQRPQLNWAKLTELCGDQVANEGSNIVWDAHVFRPLETCSSKVFNMYVHNYGTKEKVLEGGIIAANADILEKIKFTYQELREAGYAHSCLEGEANETTTLKVLCQKLGWLSLRDWYCSFLHRHERLEDAAWWAVLDTDSIINEPDNFLNALNLDWDGHITLPLDLLLIGTTSDKLGPIKWYGAAITNIGSLQPECIVQLTTNANRLEAIEKSVKDLCGDFGQTTTHALVNNCERWANTVPHLKT